MLRYTEVCILGKEEKTALAMMKRFRESITSGGNSSITFSSIVKTKMFSRDLWYSRNEGTWFLGCAGGGDFHI